ncbi:peptide/nickel transport system permease protein [Amycolatopsis bartoniae]|uniref:Peptide ABC transporter permease n=1 Tax=Amycolatopsis bartoniae TaxID=941986 RepID=A0A8H9IUF6_9PSEU|nr:ABC transporter permease [Amycolatopsis bartoniae]MBB2937694.1 peptide/nickel transport system permease protein [Amycolatopsis bartoniae]TVT08216.1 ABC transporter permease [Amycolatopsis bartoniae]GHF39984.1 peptide ABC transporter permease [Amycolatopsis bartoniae]
MTGYLLRRAGQALVVLWAAFTLSFVVLYLLPGDAVLAKLGGGEAAMTVTGAQLDQARAEYGLNDPWPVQYGKRLLAALHGDFGRSIATGDSATHVVVTALPPTLAVAGLGLVLAVLLGGGTALAGTYTRTRWLGTLLLSLPPLGISLPVFWVGLVLIQIFSFQLRLLPALGNAGLASVILPALTISLPTGAVIGQVLARSLRTQLAEPYVETVRAKGASQARVHFGHALRNAAIPVLTMVGVVAGQLLAGSVVTETVFSRDGVGRVTTTAVTGQDIPVVQAVIVLAAFFFVAVNLAVDLLYPLLDPRVRRDPVARTGKELVHG